MGEEYQMTIWEAPVSEELGDHGEERDNITESVTEIISTDKEESTKNLIDRNQSENTNVTNQRSSAIESETIKKQIIPKEYAFTISKLWETMDRRGGMEFRHVHNSLKRITSDDMTTGEVGKYLKYCNAVKIKGRKNRKEYLPGRDKWALSESEQMKVLLRKPKYEGPYTFADAVFRADEEKESKLYDDYLPNKEEADEEQSN